MIFFFARNQGKKIVWCGVVGSGVGDAAARRVRVRVRGQHVAVLRRRAANTKNACGGCKNVCVRVDGEQGVWNQLMCDVEVCCWD